MATIYDIARRAGVSHTTVSRYFNKPESLTPETRERVRAAVEELGYVPNAMARSLRTRDYGLIGAVVPSLRNPLFGRIVQAAQERLDSAGFRLVLCESDAGGETEQEFADRLMGNRVAGMLIASRSRDLSYLERFSVPVVGVERTVGPEIPLVACDNFQGGVLAAAVMGDGGARRVLLSAPDPEALLVPEDLPGERRVAGFLEECRRRRMTVTPVQDGFLPDGSRAENLAALQDMLRRSPGAEGIFVTDDRRATWTRMAALELGIPVPETLQIVGFDGVDPALAGYGVTTVAQPAREMGRRAAELLLEMIAGNPVPRETLLPVTLLQRETTRR